MKLEDEVNQFIKLAHESELRMLMVGGAAVNFHGYQRHSADVVFWIETSDKNLNKLKKVLHQMEYEFEAFPRKIMEGIQNISLKSHQRRKLS